MSTIFLLVLELVSAECVRPAPADVTAQAIAARGRYFTKDHLTGAKYLWLRVDGTYAITGREHMGLFELETGRKGRAIGGAQVLRRGSSLDIAVKPCDGLVRSTAMSSARDSDAAGPVQLLQGTLDLIVLRALATMGPQHAYALGARLQQIADHSFPLNQGTMYVALVRLEQRGWIKGTWGRTESNREAKYYDITKAGRRALEREVNRWRRLASFVDRMLQEPS